MDQYIIQLIADLKSESNERNNAAASELDIILLNPENFQFFLEILKSNEDCFIQKFILISIRSFISKNGLNENQFIESLVEILVDIIQNSKDFESRNHACKVISKISNFNPLLFSLDSIIDLFLQNEELIPFVLIILEECYMSLENPEDYDQNLMELFKMYIQSSNSEDQKIATSFFSTYIYNVDDVSILDDPLLFDVIYKSLISSIEEAKIDSIEYLTQVFCLFLNPKFEFLSKYSEMFINLAFDHISDDSVPIIIRVIIHQIFEYVDYIPEDLILQVIPISLKMSSEMCEDENLNDKYDYKFNYDFFRNVLKDDNFKGNSESFDFFISLVQNLTESEDQNFIQVSIYLLSLIVQAYNQFIDQIKELLIQAIQIGLNQENENIVNDTFALINKIMKKKSYILKPSYNDIIRFFLDYEPDKYMFVFQALCKFLYFMPELPSNLEELIEFSVKLFQDHDPTIRYYSIECLRNSIYHYRPQNEDDFTDLGLELIMKDQENITIVFELITSLIKIYPNNIKSLIPEIIDMIEQSLHENYYELDSTISILLCNLIKYFPNSMSEYTEQIQKILMFIYDFFYGDNDIYGSNFDEYEAIEFAKGQYLIFVASTFKFFDLNEEMFMTILEEFVSNEPNLYANIAIKMIADKIDPDFFLSKIPMSSSVKAQIIIMKGVGNSSDDICQHIQSEITSPEFDKSNDVFILINTFLNDGNKLPDSIIENIQKIAENEDFYHQGWAILSLVYIAHLNNDNEEITNLLKSIFSIIDTDNLNQKLLLIKAINLILIYHRDEIEFPPEIANIAHELLDDPCATFDMKNECIVTLFTTNSEISLDYAQNLLSNISLDDMPDIDFFIFLESAKELAAIISQLYVDNNEEFEEPMIKISLFLAANETQFWLQIKDEVRDLMKQILSNFSDEDLLNNLRQNEQKMNMLKANISN